MPDAGTTDLTPAARDLLAAIREALDVPYAADPANEKRAAQLHRDRASAVIGVINAVLGENCPGCTVAAAEVLRQEIVARPVTYRPCEDEQPEGGNPELPPTQPEVALGGTCVVTVDVQ